MVHSSSSSTSLNADLAKSLKCWMLALEAILNPILNKESWVMVTWDHPLWTEWLTHRHDGKLHWRVVITHSWWFPFLLKRINPCNDRNVIVSVKYTEHAFGMRLPSLSKELCYINSFLCLIKTSQDAICNHVTRVKPLGTSANNDLRSQIKHIFPRTSTSSTRQHAMATCDCFIFLFSFW